MVAKRTGAVASPSFMSAAAGFPSMSAEETKSRTSPLSGKTRAMLGPELKAVTGDAKGIDEVMSRVEALVVPLEMAPFDLFDRRYQTSWEEAMGRFRENVSAIEEMLRMFMDDSFAKQRSAESTFELLQKCHSIQES